MPPTRSRVVEVTDSFACVEGENIRLVLRLAEPGDLAEGTIPIQLRSGKNQIAADVKVRRDADGALLEGRLASAHLPARVWTMALVPDGRPRIPLQARLLTSSRQPVALLPGPTPATKMPPPGPRRTGTSPVPEPRRRVGRVWHVGAAVLSVLPATLASRLRVIARRVVGRPDR